MKQIVVWQAEADDRLKQVASIELDPQLPMEVCVMVAETLSLAVAPDWLVALAIVEVNHEHQE